MAERFRPYVTVAAIIECRGKYALVSEYDEAPYPVFGQPAGHLWHPEQNRHSCEPDAELCLEFLHLY